MKCSKPLGKLHAHTFGHGVILNHIHTIYMYSPLFCCLELVGFVLTYVSVVMMIGIPSQASCIVTPVTFSLGFLLVLG